LNKGFEIYKRIFRPIKMVVYITNPHYTALRLPLPEVDYNPSSLDNEKSERRERGGKKEVETVGGVWGLDFSLQIIIREEPGENFEFEDDELHLGSLPLVGDDVS